MIFQWTEILELLRLCLVAIDLLSFLQQLEFQLLDFLLHLIHLVRYLVRRLLDNLVYIDLSSYAFCTSAKQ